MNRNEWEQRMKDLAEEQSFPPEEAGWLKLSAALQQPAQAAVARRRLFLTPLRMAAAAALLLSAGAAVWTGLRKTGREPGLQVSYHPGLPSATKAALPSSEAVPAPVPNTIGLTASVPAHPVATTNTIAQTNVPPAENNAVTTEAEITAPASSTGLASPVNENRPAGKENLPEGPALWQGDVYATNSTTPPAPALHLGVNAQISSSTVSQAVYQVGVIGRRELSRKLYIEAGLALASNTVNNVSKHTFSTIEHNAASGVSSISTSEVEADYSRNIVSLGFSPSIGLKATRKLSVSAGAAINRNLNPFLAITNSAEIAEDALSKHIVSTSQAITNWDIGLTCNAGYQVTQHLSMSIGYRRGLSDYLLQNNSYLKNSGVQFGLKYLFGSKP